MPDGLMLPILSTSRYIESRVLIIRRLPQVRVLLAKCKMAYALSTNSDGQRLPRSQRADDRGLWSVLTVGPHDGEPGRVPGAEGGTLSTAASPQDTRSEESNVYSPIWEASFCFLRKWLNTNVNSHLLILKKKTNNREISKILGSHPAMKPRKQSKLHEDKLREGLPGGGLGQVWGLEGKDRCWGAPLWGLLYTVVGTGRGAELIHLHLFVPLLHSMKGLGGMDKGSWGKWGELLFGIRLSHTGKYWSATDKVTNVSFSRHTKVYRLF